VGAGRELLAKRPPAQVAAAIRERAALADRSTPARRLWPMAPLLAGAAATILAALSVRLFLSTALPTSSGAFEETRIKGLPHLVVFRQTVHGPERLANGSAARAGDLIQLAYQAAGHSHGVIFSVDGRGAVTRHLPREGSQAASLAPGAVALDLAYRLDDAPRWERFYLVAASRPFDADEVLRGAGAAHPLVLPAGFDQFSLTLQTEPNR
jgi:hypothetical protein